MFRRATGDKCVKSAFKPENSDFAWVEIEVDSDIQFKFYKEEPKDTHALEDAYFRVMISYADESEAPLILSEDYPYYVGMSVITKRKEKGEYKKEKSLEIPKDVEPLLSSVVKQLIIEKSVGQYKDDIEVNEENRLLAGEIIAEVIDPEAIEGLLERNGIFADPDDLLL